MANSKSIARTPTLENFAAKEKKDAAMDNLRLESGADWNCLGIVEESDRHVPARRPVDEQRGTHYRHC